MRSSTRCGVRGASQTSTCRQHRIASVDDQHSSSSKSSGRRKGSRVTGLSHHGHLSQQRRVASFADGIRSQPWSIGDVECALPLPFGRQDFLSAYPIDQVFSFEIEEMRSLFIVGQICADPLRHRHDECAVIHVHPIPSTDQFVRRIANEWTVGIDRQVRFIITGHRPNTRLEPLDQLLVI